MLSQNILNLVDTLMIGQLGTDALAGSGIGSFYFMFYLLALSGAPSSVHTMVARYKGANQPDSCSISLMIGQLGFIIDFNHHCNHALFLFTGVSFFKGTK